MLQPTKVVVEEPELVENLNRIQIEGEVAQTVDEALSILGYVLQMFYKIAR